MILHVEEAMLSPEFWIARMGEEAAHRVYNPQAINQALKPPHLPFQEAIQTLRQGGDQAALILPAGAVPQGYDRHGQPVTAAWQGQVQKNAILEPFPERWGFSVTRAALRSWPTLDPVFRTPKDQEFDQLQQTRVGVFEPLLILGQSADGQWFLVQSPIYQGWVRQDDVAWCDALTFTRFADRSHLVVITHPRQVVEPEPGSDEEPHVVSVGTMLPEATTFSVGHQASLVHVAVWWPQRAADGSLSVRPALMVKGPGVHQGFLPATRANLLRVAFSLLGERYGWGDSFDRHDCSSFVRDVFQTLGIHMPRNSSAQEQAVSWRQRLSGSYDERRIALEGALAGDVLFMPGHVMVYLGMYRGRPYALHAFVGYRHGGQVHWVNQVMVSPLDIELRDRDLPYLQGVTSVGAVLKTLE
ncbi:SH3 domain-containing protein [Sulfobacillus sp. hq2]|uniref:SH3 domain-containing protein n=1 Tax=Sulfobacillus TaxID=28033 RepID=UPI0013048C60|nr:SH3 domain-containing protein [Sulfobacillus sp. hq2]